MATIKDVNKLEVNTLKLEQNLKEALEDQEFVTLVKNLKLKKAEVLKKTGKLQTVVEEKKHCHNCKGLFMCQNVLEGHTFNAEVKENRLYFGYTPCKYKQLILNHEQEKHKVIRMKDIDTRDKKQLKVIKWMDTFFEEYTPLKEQKGLYLHGSFGSGKTYLLTSLLNELHIAKGASIEIVYFPEVLRSLKEDFELFGAKMHKYMNTDILLIDDIGAEKVTEWGRDEVLGTILQYRMENNKTTFFTSNLTIDELESRLALGSNNIDNVSARRIIERIKKLTIDLELVSEDRRLKDSE